MDLKYIGGGMFFVVFGVVMTLFHNSIGESSTKFREKIMNIVYDESIRRMNKIGFLILGLFSIIFGILLLFRKIQLR